MLVALNLDIPAVAATAPVTHVVSTTADTIPAQNGT
jgi:hypothetical protein